ncbi:hypothetical protein ABEB36_007672 [Hypothenemus hampei]|uniref:Uncharacterized protein n=1 Tax=Hypothenemus hampei TaxID=57062 RepID=A0ABD1EUV9_HYPHA
MSKNSNRNVLKHSQISKKIISKTNNNKTSSEWIDLLGKTREQRIIEYNKKNMSFFLVANSYNKLNRETIAKRQVRLHSYYEEKLNTDFLQEKDHVKDDECDPFCCCIKCVPNKTGRLLRKRSLRKIHAVSMPKGNVCLIEPWFKRYLTLNKFILTVRKVIIQNRLEKVLKKLKTITFDQVRSAEETKIQKKCEDYHCHPVFAKFL